MLTPKSDKKLVRKGTGLFEEVEEQTLFDRVNDAGAGVTTPATAAALGASPDQAKMVGTKAQKAPVLQQAVEKTQTLAGAQRLDAPRQQSSSPEQAAAQKAQQVRALGSLTTRVQSAVEAVLNQGATTATAGAAVNETALASTLGLSPAQVAAQKADPNSQYSKAMAALQQYSAAPQSEAALVALTAAGMTVEQAAAASGLLSTGVDATGAQLGAKTADNITVAQIDLGAMGFGSPAQLAGLLGVPEAQLTAMTIPQLQQAVEDMRRAEFNKMHALRQQLATLPANSMQAQEIRRQLSDMGQVGVTGVEQSVAQTAAEINTAEMIKIGGDTKSVEEVLKDSNLSSLVTRYLSASPQERDKILPADKFGDLRTWIENNQKALGDFVQSAEGTQKTFAQAQVDAKGIPTVAGVELSPELMAMVLPGYTPGTVVTSAQVADLRAQLDASLVGQIAKDGGAAAADIMRKLDPDTLNMLVQSGATAADIVKGHAMSQMISENTDILKILGWETTPKFILNGSTQARVEDAKAVIDAAANGKVSHLIADPGVLKLIKDGRITGADAAMWFRHPDALANPEIQAYIQNKQILPDAADRLLSDFASKKLAYKQQNDKAEKAKAATSVDHLVSMLFGGKTNLGTLNQTYRTAQVLATLGDKDSQGIVDRYRKLLDMDGSGEVDAGDMDRLKNGARPASLLEVLEGTNRDPFQKYDEFPDKTMDSEKVLSVDRMLQSPVFKTTESAMGAPNPSLRQRVAATHLARSTMEKVGLSEQYLNDLVRFKGYGYEKTPAGLGKISNLKQLDQAQEAIKNQMKMFQPGTENYQNALLALESVGAAYSVLWNSLQKDGTLTKHIQANGGKL